MRLTGSLAAPVFGGEPECRRVVGAEGECRKPLLLLGFGLVGNTGLEPVTSSMSRKRSSQLS